jgi:hypothetical protein
MYQLPKLKKIKSLIHAVSTKTDGNMAFNWGTKSEVRKNRKKFLKNLNIDHQNCVGMQLEHKNQIFEADQKQASRGILETNAPIADALLTSEKNLFLFLLTGDCLPIIFFDPKKEILALAHLSWKNTDTKFCQDIIRRFEKLKSDPKDIIIGIGPAIHKESYIKEKDIPDWKNYITKLDKKSCRIDLIGYNQKQLQDLGILSTNIEVSPINTVKSKDFFSHYESKKNNIKEARFVTIAGMI